MLKRILSIRPWEDYCGNFYFNGKNSGEFYGCKMKAISTFRFFIIAEAFAKFKPLFVKENLKAGLCKNYFLNRGRLVELSNDAL
jgi:hypothetical protein